MADGSTHTSFKCAEIEDDDGFGECRLCDYPDRLSNGLCTDCAEGEDVEAEDTSFASMLREHGTY